MDPTQQKKPIPKGFDMEKLFDNFLKAVHVDKRNAPPHKISDMKRAYYGGVGQLMMLQKTKVAYMSEDNASDAIQSIMDQVSDFLENKKQS